MTAWTQAFDIFDWDSYKMNVISSYRSNYYFFCPNVNPYKHQLKDTLLLKINRSNTHNKYFDVEGEGKIKSEGAWKPIKFAYTEVIKIIK